MTAGGRRPLELATRSISRANERLSRQAPRHPADAERVLAAIELRVRALDPARALARGWSITHRADGTLVSDASRLVAGDDLVTTVAMGTVRSRVTDTSPTIEFPEREP